MAEVRFIPCPRCESSGRLCWKSGRICWTCWGWGTIKLVDGVQVSEHQGPGLLARPAGLTAQEAQREILRGRASGGSGG